MRRLLRRSRPAAAQLDHGLDHRSYVGGFWDEIGALQFEFMKAQGLRPEHVLLDIACGSLRGGVHFIAYLEPGNYLGVDKEQWLIDAGLEELGPELRAEKRPELLVSDAFEFSRLSRQPDMSIAQSLFTHLVPEHVERCLANLRASVAAGHPFYATFFEGTEERPEESHDLKNFPYAREELEHLGARHGWDAQYVGAWNHPRDQKMMRFVAVA